MKLAARQNRGFDQEDSLQLSEQGTKNVLAKTFHIEKLDCKNVVQGYNEKVKLAANYCSCSELEA